MGRRPRVRLRSGEGRARVHRDDPVDLIQSDVRQRATEEHARVVDQDVEPADPATVFATASPVAFGSAA
ncbi:hypothetical protein AQJ43_30435 [Streptomyces avermitilis]|nr:hypothetical protein AQJ43_30435 [Streptomyces avermitilis]OOV24272.1 hypothetical protein SM007_31215 [Streptomyces avermitilis]